MIEIYLGPTCRRQNVKCGYGVERRRSVKQNTYQMRRC